MWEGNRAGADWSADVRDRAARLTFSFSLTTSLLCTRLSSCACTHLQKRGQRRNQLQGDVQRHQQQWLLTDRPVRSHRVDMLQTRLLWHRHRDRGSWGTGTRCREMEMAVGEGMVQGQPRDGGSGVYRQDNIINIINLTMLLNYLNLI